MQDVAGMRGHRGAGDTGVQPASNGSGRETFMRGKSRVWALLLPREGRALNHPRQRLALAPWRAPKNGRTEPSDGAFYICWFNLH